MSVYPAGEDFSIRQLLRGPLTATRITLTRLWVVAQIPSGLF